MGKKYQNYTVKEAAEKLNVSKVTVCVMIREGVFPAYKVRGIYRIPKEPFDKWLRDKNKKQRREAACRIHT